MQGPAGLQIAGLPLVGGPAILPDAIAQHVVGAERVFHALGVLLGEERGIVAEKTVQALRGERQEGRKENLERVDGLQGGVDGQTGASRSVLMAVQGAF
jgi:hypothetical protein